MSSPPPTTKSADFKFEHEETTIEENSPSQPQVVILQNTDQEIPSASNNCGNAMNQSNSVVISHCHACLAKDKEIEELRRRLKIVTEDRNNQIKLNNNLLNENIEAETKLRMQFPETTSQTNSWSASSTYNMTSSSNHLTIAMPNSSPSMAHLPHHLAYSMGSNVSTNVEKHRSIDYTYPQDDDSLVELLQKTGVYCSAVTRETGKAQPDAGHAICYLFKRFFTMDELAESSLGAHSKNGFKQLPTKIVQAIKAFVICNFTQKDGQKIGVTLLNHTINSLCGQARILKKRGKKWKVKAEKEEYHNQ